MAKEIKSLTIEQLVQKIQENKAGLESLKASGINLPEVVAQMEGIVEACEKELNGRQGEVFARSVSEPVKRVIESEFAGKTIPAEIRLELRIFTAEDGTITAETAPLRKARVASAGTSSASSGGSRGGSRKGAKVVTADGQEIIAESASAALKELKARKVIPQEMGESDSAVRVLNSLKGKQIISSWEQVELPKKEKATDEVAEAVSDELPM